MAISIGGYDTYGIGMALNSFGDTSSSLSKSISSGKRASSAEDPAKDSLGARLENMLNGTKIGLESVGMAQSIVEVAEAGVDSILKNLQTMSELALRSISTLDDEARSGLSEQFTALKSEVARVSQSTTFGSKELLSGKMTKEGLTFYLGTPIFKTDEETLKSLKGAVNEKAAEKVDGQTNQKFVEDLSKGLTTAEAAGATGAAGATAALGGAKDALAALSAAKTLDEFNTAVGTLGEKIVALEESAKTLTDANKDSAAGISKYVQFLKGVQDAGKDHDSSNSISVKFGDFTLTGLKLNAEDLGIANLDSANKALELVQSAINTVIKAKGQIGSQLKTFSSASEYLTKNIAATNSSLSIMVNVDVTSKLSEYKATGNKITAAAYALSMMNAKSQEFIERLFR